MGLALYAGHVIDHTERTLILRRSILLYSFVIFLVFVLSTSLVQDHVHRKVWISFIYALIFAGTTDLSGSAFPSLMAQIVPMHVMTNAITLNNGSFLIAAMAGHAGGGWLIAWLGIKGALFISFIFSALSCVVIFRIKAKPHTGYRCKYRHLGKRKRKDSVSYIKPRNYLHRWPLTFCSIVRRCRCTMVPAYAKDILHVGPTGFGWLNAATDIGALGTVIVLTFKTIEAKARHRFCCMLWLASVFRSIIVFGLSRSYFYHLLPYCWAASWMDLAPSYVVRLLNWRLPNEIKGRQVMSVNSMFINSSNEFGQFESGVAAKLMGLVPSVVFGGVMTLIVVGMTWWKAPKLRKLEYWTYVCCRTTKGNLGNFQGHKVEKRSMWSFNKTKWP